MRLVLVTDAWLPQINGVVRTLETLKARLAALGHQPLYVTPDRFRSVPCPTYSEIRLALTSRRGVGERIDGHRPEAVHIATEGPLGWLARAHCLKAGYPFTTAYHTQFPQYIHARSRLPVAWSYAVLRRFHGRSSAIMVATRSIEDELRTRGFTTPIRRWSRGVDTALFRPRDKGFLPFPRPISLFVGRVAVEKNIEAFLRLDLPGTKVVVGEGPARAGLAARHPEVRFLGPKVGEDLARHYAAADVFVFPSRTDTFGLVLLEALASGVPVAAYPVPGPLDVIDHSGAGVLNQDLGVAVRQALSIPPERCRAHAETFSWDRSAEQFLDNLQQVH
ncbi:MAG: glycosyltransferase family 1 protein [Rhodospirillales bacterium]|nr:MAG: glycosyltransferase family 1 protein [Rhodospirillales bacterium]